MKQKVNVVLFDGFELLDVFGPLEMFGRLPDVYEIYCYAKTGGLVKATQGVEVAVLPFSQIENSDILLIPGGMDTRALVNDEPFLKALTTHAQHATWVLTVCTGSALLAKTGLLNGRKATGNKRAFAWTMEQNDEVLWQPKARWQVDGKFYTSSGISAGIDMTLGFIADRLGVDVVKKVTNETEYIWNNDSEIDPFFENDKCVQL